MRWLSCLSLCILALGFVGGTAQAAAGCIGFTPLGLHGEGIVINGTTTRLKAVAYTVPKISGIDEEDLRLVRGDFAAIRKAGFNAVRSYEPLALTVLQAAEDEGLLIVQALVHLSDETNFDSEDELREVIERAQKIVTRDRCRRGVVMWSIWNDAPFNWGSSGGNVVERFGARTVHRFLRRLRDAVRSLDTFRPLTAANVLNAKHAEIGMDLLDVIGVNAYLGVFDWPSQRYSHKLAKETVLRVKLISEKYRKPIWISETGISSIPGADLAESVIPAQLRLIEEAGFAGFAVFQWRDDPAKAREGAQASRDIEANWGLLDSGGVPKNALFEVAAALQGNAASPDRLALTADLSARNPWTTIDRGSPTLPKSQTMEDFRFNDAESVRAAYRVHSKGRARAHIGSPGEPGRRSGGLSLRYVPEDFGAWLILGRNLEKPITLRPHESLVLDLGEHKGGSVNLTVIFKLADSRTMRTPPLLLRSRKAQSYQMKLQDLIVDSGTVGESADVAEISFRLNDVANFENVGIPVKLVIKGVHLVVAH